MADQPASLESAPHGNRDKQFDAVFRDELRLVHRRRENTGSRPAMRAALVQGIDVLRLELLQPRREPAVATIVDKTIGSVDGAHPLGPLPAIGGVTWPDAPDIGGPLVPASDAAPLNGNGAIEAGKAPRTKPHPYGLIGLALSGGGIRAASISIGALQALDKHGALRHVDYLSTVSGGGYAGCSLAANAYGYWKQQKATAEQVPEKIPEGWFFPFDHRPGVRENIVFQHLRAYANFLAPHGGSDFLYGPVLLLRGVFMNLMALAPYLLACAVALALVVEWPAFVEATAFETFKIIVIWTGIGAAILLALSRPLRFLLEKLATALGQLRRKQQGTPVANELLGKGDKWPARDFVRSVFTWISIAAAVIVFAALQPYAVWKVGLYLVKWEGGASWFAGLGGIAALAPFVSRFVALPPKVRHWATVFIAVVIGPLILWLGVLLATVVIGMIGPLTVPQTDWQVDAPWLALGVAFVLLGANWVYLYDANEVSLHSVYRDKLSKAFLFAPSCPAPVAAASSPSTHAGPVNLAQGAPDSVLHLDGLKLSEMEVEYAPYPLINAALNVQIDPDNETRGRQAAVFMFSREYVGSDLTGYCRTSELEAVNRRFTMASAMAVSGAAAAPNSGKGTMKPVRFLLALMNVRLGYWLANPRQIASGAIQPETRWRPWRVSPNGYLRELFGMISAKDRVINLSDGGHIENLGVYELLRRRCRLIIAIDAEEDPAMSFASLGDLLRFARMDMATHIDINLDDVRRAGQVGRDGLSKNHMVIGEIDYGDGTEKGLFVYLKSSLTGDEGESLIKYKAIQPLFPHHPTVGDQFYDEEQFEAYRSLGYHIADRAFARFSSTSPAGTGETAPSAQSSTAVASC